MTMSMTQHNTDRFSRFVALFSQMLNAQPRESALLSQGKELLSELVRLDDWLDPAFCQPDAQRYQQYLLHLDPAERFSVVSFVWGPAQSTPIHDHTIWGLVGMLRGSELCQPYSKMSDGRWAAAGLQLELLPGDVEVINPKLGDVHRVCNASKEQVSISIHVYGGNIGTTQRSVYTPEGGKKLFVSGYSPVPLSYHDRASRASVSTAPARGLSPEPKASVAAPQPSVQQPVIKSWMAKSAADQITQLAPLKNAQSQFKPTPPHLPISPLSAGMTLEDGVKKKINLEPQSKSPQFEHRPSVVNPSLSSEFSKSHAPQGARVVSPSQGIAIEPTLSTQKVQSGGALQASEALGAPQPALEAQQKLHASQSEKLGDADQRFISSQWVRARLLSRQELVLIDVREEDPFAKAHPLFAANFPLSCIEVDAYRRIPKRNTPIVVYDNHEGLAQTAVAIFKSMGYEFVRELHDGLQGWRQSGGEIFQDVNVPSKSFGELVQVKKQTPKVSAQQLKAWIDQNADVVILDARRFDEYQTMSIPKGVSVPGGELVLRARALAPNATTRIVVNCAGRTRSIIGTQSLVNAGLPNPVCALENGTIGWVLAGQALVTGGSEQFKAVTEADLAKSKLSALSVAIRSGVKRIDRDELSTMQQDPFKTTYLFDVRTQEEFLAGHLPKAIHAPGGQLVQETDHFAPVRGARLALYDTEGVRAHMTASWLAQMGWESFVVKDVRASDLLHKSVEVELPQVPEPLKEVSASVLKEWLSNRSNLTLVIDVGSSGLYVKAHIPGAWWILRSQMKDDFQKVHKANRYVITSQDGCAAQYAAQTLRSCVKPSVEVLVLQGGTQAWLAEGFSTQQGESYLASPRIDRYQRPYEGTNNTQAAMQAYLDWEFGLVDQLARDGTHGFKVA
jgi:predicted metal-dependent enzyme (double-stranded beta helix superfamily)/rhodanese-related sulfurtransferase